MIFDKHANLKYKFGNRHFWAEGYYVLSLIHIYQDFLKGEVRYLSLTMKNPDRAATLFARNEKEAKERYEHLSKLVALYGND